MASLRRAGLLLPLSCSCAFLVAVLSWLGPVDARYTWLRPLELLRDAFAAPYFYCLALVAYVLGRVSRPGELARWRALDRRSAVPDGLVERGTALFVCVAAADLLHFPGHTVLDYLALYVGVFLGLGAAPLDRARGVALGRAVAEALVVAGCLVLVSYVFTAVKAHLFVLTRADDAAISGLERTLFGGSLHAPLAALGEAHPALVRFSDAVYFRIFDHMLIASVFLLGVGDVALRQRYVSSLCVCYLLGGLAYYIAPSMGPAFAEPALYAHLPAHGPATTFVQGFLEENTRRVTAGELRELPAYGFVAAMPSLHLAHETVMLFYARVSRAFLALTSFFFACTAMSVLVLGFHYALDIVFGVLLAALCIALVERTRLPWFPAILTVPPEPPA